MGGIQMENIMMSIFRVESQAYQAFSELKRDPSNQSYTISQAVIIKKENGQITSCDAFDTGIETMDDSIKGGLLGSLIGILGGPFGMLLGGGIGLLIGANSDLDDKMENASLLENVANRLEDGDVALMLLVQETNEAFLDAKLSAFDTTTLRWDAAVIKQEVEEADMIRKQLADQLRKTLRSQKSEKRKQSIEEKKQEIKQKFEQIKKKIKSE